jgi:hypothetical protein
MTDERPEPPPARARPVADAPAEALAARAEELARRWAVALILTRPLAEMATVPLGQIAGAAPELCASISRALRSEEELISLAGGPVDYDDGERHGRGAAPAGLGVLAGQWDAATAVLHVEALRGVLWEAALEELRDPSPRLLADLSDRLAFVCAAVLADALTERAQQVPAPVVAAPQEPRERVLFSAPTSAPGQSAAVLIDELELAHEPQTPAALRRRESDRPATSGHDDRREASAAAPEPRVASPAEGTVARTAPRPLPWDTPLDFSSGPPEEPAGEPSQTREQDPVMRLSRGRGAPVDRRH